jgi:putative phosphoribosyl transferase
MCAVPVFSDRAQAGRELASKLKRYEGRDDVIVLGLPRGGVPVAFEVAESLGAPLDVFVVRKLGVPGREELAMGAIATGGVCVLNPSVIVPLNIGSDVVEAVATRERRELERREHAYRDDRPAPSVRGRVVVLVDDGLATGATMKAAAAAIQQQEPAEIVVAVPVGSRESCDELRDYVDDVVCARTPEPFYGVGLWYSDFSQTSDEDVHDLLEQAARTHPVAPGRA